MPEIAAFPHADAAVVHPGMSLRDYFAAAALKGILSTGDTASSDWLAEQAYLVADAMMERRTK